MIPPALGFVHLLGRDRDLAVAGLVKPVNDPRELWLDHGQIAAEAVGVFSNRHVGSAIMPELLCPAEYAEDHVFKPSRAHPNRGAGSPAARRTGLKPPFQESG